MATALSLLVQTILPLAKTRTKPTRNQMVPYTDLGAHTPHWDTRELTHRAHTYRKSNLSPTPAPFCPGLPRTWPGRSFWLSGKAARAVTVARARQQAPRVVHTPLRKGSLLRIPMAWFWDPFLNGLRIAIRPPIASMKRTLHSLTFPFPRACFDRLMEPVNHGVCKVTTVNGRVQPTTRNAAANIYDFTIGIPSLVAKMLSLSQTDLRGRAKAPRGRRYKRGQGAARLILSEADEKRGMAGKLLAMVAGLLNIRYREPRREGGMPTLQVSFFVLTMDRAGHIIWPTNFALKTRATLRLLARREVKLMLADPLYPIDPLMSNALSNESESYLSLADIRLAAGQRASELAAERARLRVLPTPAGVPAV